ncbi:hypothetical protein DKX38_019593 [Salix brachista]|uniref:Uncharacterized protein n=1 Tax=Salix brachista TaxID=2182728 RepID=A0A5N5KGM7_9ROSI|nr:hypothetical protein DKX38_019593 [Salix brachista]
MDPPLSGSAHLDRPHLNSKAVARLDLPHHSLLKLERQREIYVQMGGAEDLEGVDASFEQLVEETREAAGWDEAETENLLTEKIVTEFVKFHVKKAERERRLQGRGDEISEKRRTMPSKSLERNSLAKKRLQELLERDSNKEEEAEKAIVP